jgi:hypothetical protein
MKTGAPIGIVWISQRAWPAFALMQPELLGWPMLASSLVAWTASRSPPGHPGGKLVWWPVSASTQQPYGELTSVTRSLSVTVNRPCGVGLSGRPTATVSLRTILPSSRTTIRRFDRSA